MYEVCLSYNIFFLIFYFKTILTNFFSHQISGIYLTRGKEFRKYWPQRFESEADKAKDEWWREIFLIDDFNAACKNIADSFLKVGDESMSAIRFRKTTKGNLPHLYYISHEPEPLVTGFKTSACSVKGALLFIEVQRGN